VEIRLPFPRLLSCIALMAAAALFAPGTAAAATNKCPQFTSRYTILAQSSQAVVVKRGDVISGCLFADGRLRTLRNPDPSFNVLSDFTLAGRYVAYQLSNEEPAAAIATSSIYVVDLRTGKTKVNADAWPPGFPPMQEFSYFAEAIVLRSNGSVAWIAKALGNTPPDEPILVARRVGTRTTVLDRGKDIATDSLALARSGKTIYWTRGSTTKSASLG